MPDFKGFPREGLSLLTDLGAANKARFEANRATYTSLIADPAKVFVSAMGDALVDISPAIEAQPKTNGSIGPINNDLRFSPDKSPYKDHLLFRFWEGSAKKTAPTLFVRVHSTDGIGFATGLAFTDLDGWRSVIDADATGAPLAAAIEALAAETTAEVDGAALRKVPKPFAEDHPRGALLKHKGLQVRWILPTPEEITSADFVPWCMTELMRTREVHRLLVENFG